ncbi:M15 family metallopeptidase [Thermomonas flagellata]|uniref:M15 family metallopeptidase n=1 Tax=Thermomonas flagellata TaxID=2888524 RepID=UPI001F049E6F|nr:M15 family metallopeptidase [Thermomonas flagellata]
MSLPRQLHNTRLLELWPAWLLRARRGADARLLSGARWLLRHKADRRYLALLDGEGRVQPLLPRAALAPDLRCAIAETGLPAAPSGPPRPLALDGLEARLQALGLDAASYAARSGLAPVPEPDWLQLAGRDRWRRPLWLHPQAAHAWHRMQAAALADGIVLEALSGYRSHDVQLGIFARKRARGLAMEAILSVNAAPGFSEHHSGCALDIRTPGAPPAEEAFERTPAFAWLQAHAPAHGFTLSYPRGNPHGIAYEPWHWCWRPPPAMPAQGILVSAR